MHSRTPRVVFALIVTIFVAVSATAAPEGRSESGNWLSRQINRIVLQLSKFFVPQSLDDPSSSPPKP
jgi:hypothetical protein